MYFRAFKPSYTFSSIYAFIYIFEHLSLHIHFCGWGGSSQKQNSKINGLYIFEHLSLHIHFRAFKPSYTFSWMRRFLPETKFKNKWTLFIELFDLSDLYIFEHLSLHIYFRAFKPSYGSDSPGWVFRPKCGPFFLKVEPSCE